MSIKSDGPFEYLKLQFEVHFRRAKRLLMTKERKMLEAPTTDAQIEVAEVRGYLRGLQKGLDFVETKRADNELPIFINGGG